MSKNDCILEFEVFFGGSLATLSLGLKSNAIYNNNKLIGIDTFATVVKERVLICNQKNLYESKNFIWQ